MSSFDALLQTWIYEPAGRAIKWLILNTLAVVLALMAGWATFWFRDELKPMLLKLANALLTLAMVVSVFTGVFYFFQRAENQASMFSILESVAASLAEHARTVKINVDAHAATAPAPPPPPVLPLPQPPPLPRIVAPPMAGRLRLPAQRVHDEDDTGRTR